jgi:hypothetical protein
MLWKELSISKLQTTFGPGFNSQYDHFRKYTMGSRYDGVPRRVGPILADGSFQLLPCKQLKKITEEISLKTDYYSSRFTLSGGDENSTTFRHNVLISRYYTK